MSPTKKYKMKYEPEVEATELATALEKLRKQYESDPKLDVALKLLIKTLNKYPEDSRQTTINPNELYFLLQRISDKRSLRGHFKDSSNALEFLAYDLLGEVDSKYRNTIRSLKDNGLGKVIDSAVDLYTRDHSLGLTQDQQE